MTRTASPRRSALSLASLVALAAAGCRAPEAPIPAEDRFSFVRHTFDDGTPEYVPAGALDAVVLLSDPVHSTLGSGIVIAPDRILTALHVVADMPRDERGRLELQVDGEAAIAVLEACGDVDGPHGDWAVLAFELPRWRRAAIVHPAAHDDGWVPARGQKLLLVGYAKGFFPDLYVDVAAPTPSVEVEVCENGREHPCWYAVGEPLHLGGMSGGAAMIWNHDLGRAELIGIFRGYVGSETRTTQHRKIHGVTVQVDETVEPGIAFTIHRLPVLVRRPTPARTAEQGAPRSPLDDVAQPQ